MIHQRRGVRAATGSVRFHEEFFELIPDWHVESVRVLQAADDMFINLDRGRGSGAPIEIDIASMVELRDGLPARVHQYTSWERGLLAAGLDPSIAADVRRPERQTTS